MSGDDKIAARADQNMNNLTVDDGNHVYDTAFVASSDSEEIIDKDEIQLNSIESTYERIDSKMTSGSGRYKIDRERASTIGSEYESKNDIGSEDVFSCDTIDTGVSVSADEPDADYERGMDSDEDSSVYSEAGMDERNRESERMWDVFSEVPWPTDQEQDERVYTAFRKAFKVITYAVFFFAVLTLAFISKSSLLIAVTNLRPPLNQNKTLQCLKYSDSDSKPPGNKTGPTYRSECIAVPPIHLNSTLSCLHPPTNPPNHKYTPLNHYIGTECVDIRLLWAWSIFLMITSPFLLTFIRCLWTISFKKKNNPNLATLATVLLIETLHTIGLSVLMFYVLPSMNNAYQCIMLLSGVAMIPSLLLVFSRPSPNQAVSPVKVFIICCNIMACVSQLSVLCYSTFMEVRDRDVEKMNVKLVVTTWFSLFLVSFRWWENFVDGTSILNDRLAGLASRTRGSRTKTQLVSSLWKIVVTLLVMIGCIAWQENDLDPLNNNKWNWEALFNLNAITCNGGSTEITSVGTTLLPRSNYTWMWTWLVNISSSLGCYYFTRVSAKIQIQRVSYALPLLLCTPITTALVLGGCKLWSGDPCYFVSSSMDGHFFYKCSADLNTDWTAEIWYLLPICWLSMMWICRHIWTPKSEKLASTDTIYLLPLFDSVLLEESLLLNRNRNDERKSQQRTHTKKTGMDQEGSDFLSRLISRKDRIPFVYICATMWHENRGEMIQMLKSIFRLDNDQAARKNVQQYFNKELQDYYEFEAHIFFDNSMNSHDETEHEYTANDYVALLVSVMGEAASAVHENMKTVPPPTKFPTPYGGRLEWTLPGANKLIVHLKDNVKIRHKKRWSQVMYMYYFLGFKLWMEDELPLKRKQNRADNTFLLALDGDVDFEPHALILLIDLMKRSDKVGAVCGRIHPIGSGPMVWYQEFEYALGHWMQKATEDVIGCVLCSPGCFSLFRGSVLMDENIMKRYTTMPTEARHHVQYDQGEDRWLCTLILQQGYRIEYCAASDSYTNAPEGFDEFFNQRRRWMPSTMANVVDLLQSWKHTTSVNENISFLYIFYQGALLVASLLSPGIIFMMISGAMVAAVKEWTTILNVWSSALINLVPIVIFVILCFKAKGAVQLWFAWILSAVYILVQFLVLVGTLVTMFTNKLCHPTTVFFLGVAGIFVLSACLHPQEFACLIKGFTYYFAIPTMYMILMIYAMCNLHVVTWGTREVKKTASEKEMEEARMEAAEAKRKAEEAKKKGGITNVLDSVKKKTTSTVDRDFKCRSLCNFICCSQPDELREPIVKEEEIKKMAEEFEDMKTNIVELKKMLEPRSRKTSLAPENSVITIPDDKITPPDNNVRGNVESVTEVNEVVREVPVGGGGTNKARDSPIVEDEEEEVIIERDELVNPAWIEDPRLGNGEIKQMGEREIQFFQDLIEKYLKPLTKNKEEEKKAEEELKALRNSIAVAFLFANSVFVIGLFFLQLNAGTVYVPWPCEDPNNKDANKVDPLGFFFLAMFGSILVIQTVSMIIHRLSTFFHIMANTLLCGGPTGTNEAEYLELAKNLGRLDIDKNGTCRTTMSSFPGTLRLDGDDAILFEARKTKPLFKIDRDLKMADVHTTVNGAFLRRLTVLKEKEDLHLDQFAKNIFGANTVGDTHRRRMETLRTVRGLPSLQSHNPGEVAPTGSIHKRGNGNIGTGRNVMWNSSVGTSGSSSYSRASRKTIESGRVTITKRNNLRRLSEERFDSMSADGINFELKERNKDAPTGGRYTHYPKTTNVEKYAAHDARSADELGQTNDGFVESL